MTRGVIFYIRALFDPGTQGLTEGCKGLLEGLRTKGYILCLFGRTSDNRVELICLLRPFELFGRILFASNDRIRRHLQECLEYGDLEPSETFVVGTRVGKEIAIGKRMGMKTILYRSGRFRSRLPVNQSQVVDFIVFDIRDVINFLV